MNSLPLCPSLSFCPPCSPHTQAHSPLPLLPKIQPPVLETPPLVFAPVDPTSGPKLVKCEKWPLYGRRDPREPPDIIDYESILPDLENDDMFARRTQTFQFNADLAAIKNPPLARRRFCTSEPQLNIVMQRAVQDDDYPDIEKDDVVYRREKIQQDRQERPLSGAPDNYAPMSIPEPWELPPDLKARLLCPPSPLSPEAKAAPNSGVVDLAERSKKDDMLVRKLGTRCDGGRGWQGALSGEGSVPSVPASCSDGDLQKWQAIREASQLRYKKKLLVERLAALKL